VGVGVSPPPCTPAVGPSRARTVRVRSLHGQLQILLLRLGTQGCTCGGVLDVGHGALAALWGGGAHRDPVVLVHLVDCHWGLRSRGRDVGRSRGRSHGNPLFHVESLVLLKGRKPTVLRVSSCRGKGQGREAAGSEIVVGAGEHGAVGRALSAGFEQKVSGVLLALGHGQGLAVVAVRAEPALAASFVGVEPVASLPLAPPMAVFQRPHVRQMLYEGRLAHLLRGLCDIGLSLLNLLQNAFVVESDRHRQSRKGCHAAAEFLLSVNLVEGSHTDEGILQVDLAVSGWNDVCHPSRSLCTIQIHALLLVGEQLT